MHEIIHRPTSRKWKVSGAIDHTRPGFYDLFHWLSLNVAVQIRIRNRSTTKASCPYICQELASRAAGLMKR